MESFAIMAFSALRMALLMLLTLVGPEEGDLDCERWWQPARHTMALKPRFLTTYKSKPLSSMYFICIYSTH